MNSRSKSSQSSAQTDSRIGVSGDSARVARSDSGNVSIVDQFSPRVAQAFGQLVSLANSTAGRALDRASDVSQRALDRNTDVSRSAIDNTSDVAQDAISFSSSAFDSAVDLAVGISDTANNAIDAIQSTTLSNLSLARSEDQGALGSTLVEVAPFIVGGVALLAAVFIFRR